MLTCIIIEDQAPAQSILQKYIGNTEGIALKKTCADAIEATAYLNDNMIDLVFLDINLPRLSGMDFLRRGCKHPFTILTTAYSEFALESYRFNVVDYLLKPFSFERFSQAVEKVFALTRSIQQVTEQHALQSPIYIKTSFDVVKIDPEEIIFIKSDCDYTEVITTTSKYLTSDTLKTWAAKLGDDFRQVHKSYIINVRHLKKIAHNKISMTNDQIVPIGRAFKKTFIENLFDRETD
jgi:DNA-binding LytR/AlgR family response regulator